MSGRRRRRSVAGMAGRGALWTFAAVQVAHALLLRQRRSQLEALPAVEVPDVDGSGVDVAGVGVPRGDGGPGDGVVVAGPGVDERTRAAAAALMAGAGVDVVDLVPGDLPVERLLALLGRVDLERLGVDPRYTPGGAHEALVLSGEVAERVGRSLVDGATGDRGGLIRLTVAAQQHAPARAVLRRAPGLRSRPWTPAERWDELRELSGGIRLYLDLSTALVGARTVQLAALAGGVVAAPLPGLVALAAWSAKPLVALAGAGGGAGDQMVSDPSVSDPAVGDAAGGDPSVSDPAVRGAGELVRASVGRLVHAAADNVRMLRAHPGPVATFDDPPAPPPPDELFEPPRSTCPWCGAGDLAMRLETGDLMQYKPGTFRLDECRSCGHVFQNPRLSLRGLAHYYEGFYDGVGDQGLETGFGYTAPAFAARIDAIAAHAEPGTWLDLGTGHGEFCLAARQRFPKARFDGLDMGAAVVEGERRGWIDRAHVGQLTELADGLAGSYDVVTMNHYLEHTREPRDEVAAAARVLVPGGLLLIEGPDLANPWVRLGRYYVPFFQPQHQHFITYEALVEELERQGFEVLSGERAPAGIGHDLMLAAILLAGQLAGPPRLPWLPAPSTARRFLRPAVLTAAAPVVMAAYLADRVKDAWQTRPGSTTPGNAYRVVARRRPEEGRS